MNCNQDLLAQNGVSMFPNWLLFFVLSLCFGFCHHLNAQTTSRVEGNSVTASQSSKTFADQFWTYLLSNNYKHWSPGPGESGDYFESQNLDHPNSPVASPHGALLKTYMNRTAVGQTKTLPVGSVIIMENYRVDQSLESISVMYKSKGFNPEANDWYWVNYLPDGSVSKSATEITHQPFAIDVNGVQQTFASAKPKVAKELMGRANSCIQCHSRSNGSDLVFFNDVK